jgi:hypothetical protein
MRAQMKSKEIKGEQERRGEMLACITPPIASFEADLLLGADAYRIQLLYCCSCLLMRNNGSDLTIT